MSLKKIDCLTCGNPVEVDHDIDTAVCGTCMAHLIPAPAAPATKRTAKTRAESGETPAKAEKAVKAPKLTKKGEPRKKRGEGQPYVPSGFPRGWHFKKKYVHTDGKVYSRGQLITDPAKIAALEA